MPMFLKDQWQQWARDWGLVHRPQKGWLAHRTESVVGERNGYLIRVGWGTDQNPGLITCIRFPRATDLERIRQVLIEDPSLDSLPGKGAARRKMAIGPAKAVQWSRRPEFRLTESSLLWQRTFPWSSPKAARVQAWVDALIAALGRATPRFDGRCETCATGEVRQYVLVDDLPTLMCTTCQQRAKAEGDMADRTYDMIEVRHLPGAALGFGAALVCAMAWAGVAVLTNRIFAAAGVGIGAFVAFAYRHGAGRVDAAGRVIGACLALLSVVLGEILLLTWWAAKAVPGLGFNLEVGVRAYARVWVESPGQELVPLLFGLVGAWVASKALDRPKLHAKIEAASGPDERNRAA